MCFHYLGGDSNRSKRDPASHSFCHALIASIQKGYSLIISTPVDSSSSSSSSSSLSSLTFTLHKPFPIRRFSMAAEFLQNQQQHQQQQPDMTKNDTVAREQQRSVPIKMIGNYTLQQSIGKGSMGKVKLATHNVTGEKVRYTTREIQNQLNINI